MTTVTNNVAYEIPCLYVGTLEANVDLSVAATYQFTAIDVGTATASGLLGASALVVPVSSGASILGVLQDSPTIGVAGTVMVLGLTRAQAAGTFNAGTLVTTDATGKFKAAASGDYACGKAVTPGLGAGVQFTLFLMGYGKQ